MLRPHQGGAHVEPGEEGAAGRKRVGETHRLHDVRTLMNVNDKVNDEVNDKVNIMISS